ncbi:hypothetical protein LUZ61_013031 [Rhynchospora tenuis]|uniref:Uncharacterized protein n=1 Tax=Rhynchospora tenuis TaxID=198213 RepID=A0AAD6A4B1_9POAL|nr:hypothetical protein LUZ61_013031 [Rhynchospora tenuis]
MAAKSPTVDAIAITEKKMDMTLDEIISMSKKGSAKGKLPHRTPIKNRGFQNGGPPPKGFKARQYNDSRSAVRQGMLAKRRTNFNGKSNFPVTSNIAKKAASAPFRSQPAKWNQSRVVPTPTQKVLVANGPIQFENGKKPQTMDALFARMQKQRRRTNPQLTAGPSNTNRQVVQRSRPHQQQMYQQQQRRPYGPAAVYK